MASFSNVVGSHLQPFRQNLSGSHFSVEPCAFLGVLQYSWYFDGARPVDVVEALREDQLLKVALFEFTVACYDFIVVGDGAAASGLLRYDVKIVVFAYDRVADESAREDVSGGSVSRKEPF